MNVVFGFGPYHEEETKRVLVRLGNELARRHSEDPEEVAKEFMAALGTFKETGFKFGLVRLGHSHERYPGAKYIAIEGTYSHYRDDHPMSPDGFASLEFPFSLVVYLDDLWHPRFYISLDSYQPEQLPTTGEGRE